MTQVSACAFASLLLLHTLLSGQDTARLGERRTLIDNGQYGL
jgi:hypothetical protein